MDNTFHSFYPRRKPGRPKIFENDKERRKYHELLAAERKRLKRFIRLYNELSTSPFDEVEFNVKKFVIMQSGLIDFEIKEE